MLGRWLASLFGNIHDCLQSTLKYDVIGNHGSTCDPSNIVKLIGCFELRNITGHTAIFLKNFIV